MDFHLNNINTRIPSEANIQTHLFIKGNQTFLKLMKLNDKKEKAIPILSFSPLVFVLIFKKEFKIKILLVAYNEEVLEEVEAEVVERTGIDVSLVDHILFILNREYSPCVGFQDEQEVNPDLTNILFEKYRDQLYLRSRHCSRVLIQEDQNICSECREELHNTRTQEFNTRQQKFNSRPQEFNTRPQEFNARPQEFNTRTQDTDTRHSSIIEVSESIKEEKRENRFESTLHIENIRPNQKLNFQKSSRLDCQEGDHITLEETDVNTNSEVWEDQEYSKGKSKRISRSKLLSENNSDLDNQKQFDLTCDIDGCQMKLRKESQLAAHVYKIHPDTQHPIRDAYLKCPNEGCFKVFPVRRLVTLNNHAKICPNLMIKSAKECSICLKTFSSVHNLKKHISGVHSAPTLPCHICGALLKGEKPLRAHIKLVHGETRFFCPEPGCGVAAKNKDHIKDHVAAVHQLQPRYMCTVCGTRYKYRNKWKYCEDKHKGVYLYSCSLCSKQFNDKRKYEVHQRVHTGEKPYACPICNFRMARIDNLNAHTKKTHGVTWREAEKITRNSVISTLIQDGPNQFVIGDSIQVAPSNECPRTETKLEMRPGGLNEFGEEYLGFNITCKQISTFKLEEDQTQPKMQ